MFSLKTLHTYALLLSFFMVSSCNAQYPDLKDGIYANIETVKGDIVLKLYYKKTPITVANFIALAEGTNTLVDDKYKDKKFFDGLKFHRVINDFMIQGGDPLGNGMGNPGYRFKDEFHPELKHDSAGILSMANSGPATNGSQFFITHKETPWLDNKHTVFGKVVKGLDIVNLIKQGDIIQSVKIIKKGSDAKEFNAAKLFTNHMEEAERIEKEKAAKDAAILKATNAKFDAQRQNVIELPSGLKYLITKKGSGEKLPLDATLKAHYAVYFDNGKILETSKLETAEALNIVNENRKSQNGYQPITFEIGPDAKMIPGFKEGVQQLSVGDKATLFIPYHLAYGESGSRGIPGKTNLIFEVEILELLN